MKTINLLLVLSLLTFIFACGGGETEQKEAAETTEPTESEQAEQQPMEEETTTAEIRTIDIIGIDEMKFAVKSGMEGITVGETIGKEGDLLLLETIEVEAGEEIRIRLTTRSQLPASAMAHNWILLVMGADGTAYANKAAQAKDEDYLPSELSDQVLYHTELVAGGETTEITFTAPSEPGDYEYLCSFPGHYAAGMKGTLKVSGEETEMETE